MEVIQDNEDTIVSEGFSFEDGNIDVNDLTGAVSTTSYDVIMDGIHNDTEVIEDWTATSTSNQTNYRHSILYFYIVVCIPDALVIQKIAIQY